MAPMGTMALVGGALERPTQFFNVGKTLPENPGSVQLWLVCLVGMFMINPSESDQPGVSKTPTG